MNDKPTVVCLPGLQGSGAVFVPLTKALGGRFHTLALDLPPGSPAKAAELLETKLQEAGRGRVHVVAGSYGGLLALHLKPQRLESLCLIATCPVASGLPAHFRFRAHSVGLLPASLQHRLYRAHLRRSLQRDKVPIDIATRVVNAAPSSKALLERLQGARQARAALDSSVPMLWVRGTEDPQVAWEDELVAKHWPQAVIATVPGGHRPYASHPELLTSILESFWKSGAVNQR